MENKEPIKMLDKIQACCFGAMAILAFVGAIANEAWWHLGTAVMMAVLAWASYSDMKEDEQ